MGQGRLWQPVPWWAGHRPWVHVTARILLVLLPLALAPATAAASTEHVDVALRRRQQINTAQHDLIAPLTEGRGFSEPIVLAPTVYRALLSEFEARRSDYEYTSLEAANGYNSATPRPFLTRLRNAVLAEVEAAMRPIVERWAGAGQLELTGLYGVRTYVRGATLEPHVDRLSHAVSAIVQVSQEDMAEPWPISIHDHGGTPHNLTLRPGEVVLYESARLVHGRSQPLNGSSFSNLFVHWRPVAGWHYTVSQLGVSPWFVESLAHQPTFDIGTTV